MFLLVIIDFVLCIFISENLCAFFFNLQGKISSSGAKSPKAGKQSTPVRPLSPRTDNVPSSSKSPKKLKESSVGPLDKNNSATPIAHQSPKKTQRVGTPDFLFGLSPTSFYKASMTPRALKKLSDEQEAKGRLSASSTKLSPGQVCLQITV